VHCLRSGDSVSSAGMVNSSAQELCLVEEVLHSVNTDSVHHVIRVLPTYSLRQGVVILQANTVTNIQLI